MKMIKKGIQLIDSFGIQSLKEVELGSFRDLDSDEVLLRIESNSLNYRDLLVVQGIYDKNIEFPLIPISDASAVVEKKGSAVSMDLGQRVNPLFAPGWESGPLPSGHLKENAFGANRDGLLTSGVILRENELVTVPSYLTAAEAACLPCAGLTAWHALFEEESISKGDLVVCQGTGGVSLFALIFAKAFGAEVMVLSSSDDKLKRCKDLGADHLVNYKTTPKWSKVVKEISNGLGADHIIELGGKDTLEQSVKSVKSNGVISLIGVLSGAVAPLILPLVVMRNVRLQGVTVGSKAMHVRMLEFMETHQIHPIVGSEFDFNDSVQAFRLLESGNQFGKIVINH